MEHPLCLLEPVYWKEHMGESRVVENYQGGGQGPDFRRTLEFCFVGNRKI